jgi:hypothetical protein
VETNGDLPGQLQVSCTRGFLAFFVALNYCTWHQDTLSVRLYRSGYETVELKAWMFGKDVQWKPVASVADRCKAIDDLMAGNLEPGGVSKEHKTALLFAAGEYKRLVELLSNSDPQGAVMQQQIAEKAAILAKRAAESSQRGWVERLID